VSCTLWLSAQLKLTISSQVSHVLPSSHRRMKIFQAKTSLNMFCRRSHLDLVVLRLKILRKQSVLMWLGDVHRSTRTVALVNARSQLTEWQRIFRFQHFFPLARLIPRVNNCHSKMPPWPWEPLYRIPDSVSELNQVCTDARRPHLNCDHRTHGSFSGTNLDYLCRSKTGDGMYHSREILLIRMTILYSMVGAGMADAT